MLDSSIFRIWSQNVSIRYLYNCHVVTDSTVAGEEPVNQRSLHYLTTGSANNIS